MTLPVTELEPLVAIAHLPRFNENANALASAALYGIRQSRTIGLRLTLYGGVYRGAGGTVSVVPEQYVNLTPSETNYIYADSGGVLSQSIAPAPTAGTLLYTLIVGTDEITSGTCHLSGRKTTGPQGPVGATGEVGSGLWLERRRISQIIGDSSFFAGGNQPGFEMTQFGSQGNIAVSSATFYDSIFKQRYMERTTQNLFCGNRGVEFNARFGIDSGAGLSPADYRCFVGLYDITAGTPSILPISGGGVEVSTFVNIVGVGCDSADTNLSIMHNDASGTATSVGLGSGFPAKAASMGGTGRIYDISLSWEAGASSVGYSVIECSTSTTLSGTVSTNFPASTQFLGLLMFAGGNHAQVTTMLCQMVANSRY